MITIYRDEHNKLQQSIVEDNPKYLSLGQEVFANHRKFVITNIDKTDLKRVIHLMELKPDTRSIIDYKNRRGDYKDVEKIIKTT